MIRKFFLPVLAGVGMLAALMAVNKQQQPVVSQPGTVAPASNPYAAAVSGAGIIEPESENIAVAPAIGGIVTDVFVGWGQTVKEGDKLMQIDPRPLKAQLAAADAEVMARLASLAQAQANLDKLRAGSREEDKKISQAKVDVAKVQVEDTQDQWKRAEKLAATRALSDDELNRRKYLYLTSQANLELTQADNAKVLAGSWERDIAVQEAAVRASQAEVEAAKAKLATLQVDVDRLTVRAPVAGKVLRINVRKGEFIAAAGVGSASDGAIVIGDVDHLHVRVDVDENDVARFNPEAAATGFARGNTKVPLALSFVRVEPFVIPKKNLTGASAERVDTRVLQVIYRLDKGNLPLYVGQQMDVYVDAGGAR